MSVLTKSELSTNAQTIATETAAGANTAAIIGGMFQDIVDSGIFTIKVSLSSAEILQLNTTPKVLVAAAGAGKVIQPVSMLSYLTYGTSSYSTNTTLRVKYSGIANNFLTNTILGLSANSNFTQTCLASLQFNSAVDNTALVLDVANGDPTAGDGTLIVYLTYMVISL